MKIAIACDHAGFELKEHLKERLKSLGHELNDFGTDSSSSTDYPDYAHPLARDVVAKNSEIGILICGSGNGVCMTANKHQGVRAALCWNTELGELARLHNNANVLCLPSRFIEESLADRIVDAFIETDFEGGRHERRVEKINAV